MIDSIDFNPYSYVRLSLKAIFKSPEGESAQIVKFADDYLSIWEVMFSNQKSQFSSITKPATPTEIDAVAESANYLCRHILTLSKSFDDQNAFERQFFSEIARISETAGFADSGLHEHAANSIVMSASMSLFILRDSQRIAEMSAVATSILFCFIRYPNWIIERSQ